LTYGNRPYDASGLTEPSLHVFAGDTRAAVVRTDGATYAMPGGAQCNVANPAAAVAMVARSGQMAAQL
jgi:hypothetical protein